MLPVGLSLISIFEYPTNNVFSVDLRDKYLIITLLWGKNEDETALFGDVVLLCVGVVAAKLSGSAESVGVAASKI